jgi:hypothetical protein
MPGRIPTLRLTLFFISNCQILFAHKVEPRPSPPPPLLPSLILFLKVKFPARQCTVFFSSLTQLHTLTTPPSPPPPNPSIGDDYLPILAPEFLNFKEPKNRFQGTNFVSLCSLAVRYDNPIPTRFLAPIDCLKIPKQTTSRN